MKITKTAFVALAFIGLQLINAQSAKAQQKGEPFEGIDASWQNGNDRRDSSIFKNMPFFTPSVLMDVN